jgi:hypothetical protein
LTKEARSLTNALEDVSDKLDTIPDNKKPQLLDAYESCVDVLQELDKLLLHYNGLDTKSRRAWDRMKWDPERSKMLRDKLSTSVLMLNTFYTSLIHDNQVLILEALRSLEHDYRGGHREESIASVQQLVDGAAEENTDHVDDAAWGQITRDLEDVGISAQDALDYREFIIDWFVRAVNEGRLLEDRAEPVSLATMPRDLGSALLPVNESPGWKTPRLSPGPSLHSQPSFDGRPVRPESSVSVVSPSVDPKAPGRSSDESPEIAPRTANTNHTSTQEEYGEANEAPSQRLPRSPTAPPAYEELSPIPTGDLGKTAKQIVDAWAERDFAKAGTLLENQLAEVERGVTIIVNGQRVQPDRRILKHLIGVCASYSGNYEKAKRAFESVFNGLYLAGGNLDEGDVAAARWLGDVCLHLNEVQNTALAWGVALNGLIGRFGVTQVLTQRVHEELRLLDARLDGLKMLKDSFARNIDASTIFMETHALEKANVITTVMERMRQMHSGSLKAPSISSTGYGIMADPKSFRPRISWTVAEGFLVQPVVSLSSWPLQWDFTFTPLGAIYLQWYMSSSIPHSPTSGSWYNEVPSVSLISSKELTYITKREIGWLVHAVKSGLEEVGIEHKERGPLLLCRLEQRRDKFAFFEGIGIKFKKVQFRNMYGLKVTSVMFATRGIRWSQSSGVVQNTMSGESKSEEFRQLVKDICENAEIAAKLADAKMRGEA